jgi:hypothetical protein
MDNPSRAVQFWSVLTLAARNRQLLTYTIMQELTGIPKFGQGAILELLVCYCKAKNFPKLTVILVGEEDGLPQDKLEQSTDVCRMQAEVFGFSWRDKKAPMPEDFKTLTKRATGIAG